MIFCFIYRFVTFSIRIQFVLSVCDGSCETWYLNWKTVIREIFTLSSKLFLIVFKTYHILQGRKHPSKLPLPQLWLTDFRKGSFERYSTYLPFAVRKEGSFARNCLYMIRCCTCVALVSCCTCTCCACALLQSVIERIEKHEEEQKAPTNKREDDSQKQVVGLGLNSDLIGLNLNETATPANCDKTDTPESRYVVVMIALCGNLLLSKLYICLNITTLNYVVLFLFSQAVCFVSLKPLVFKRLFCILIILVLVYFVWFMLCMKHISV